MGDSDISWSHHLTPTEEKFIISIETNGGSFFNACPPRTGRQAVSLPLPACPGRQDASGLPPIFPTPPAGEVARLGALGQRGRADWRRGRMLLVTGGAGFIGSNLVAGLNEAGRTDIVVNDALGD